MPKKPSSWVNFQDYLGVNAEGGQAMADRVAGNVGAQAGSAATALQTAAGTVKNRTAAQGKAPVQAGSSADATIGGANAAYSGPESLDAVDPNLGKTIADASARVKRAGTAGGQANILSELYGPAQGPAGVGGGALDSALLSGVGGGATMQGLQSQYGKLGEQYAGAQKTAADQIASGKSAATAAQGQWDALQKQLAGEEAGRRGVADKAVADADFEAKWAAAQSSNALDEVNRAFSSFNSIMSPITQVAENTGNRDPIADWGRNLIHPDAGKASGGTRGQKIWWQPHQKEVFRQMDPAQWQVLNSLPPQAQQRWIEQRRQEIAAGKPAQPFRQAGRDFSTDPHKYL